jgi:hypothetical protein
LLQVPHFIATLNDQVLAQVTAGDALGGNQGLAQWDDDLLSDQPGGQ